MNGFTASEEGTAYGISHSACDLQLLRLRLKKNSARNSETRTTPPITPPMIAFVGFPGEELLDELIPDGMLVVVVVIVVFEDVEDGAPC